MQRHADRLLHRYAPTYCGDRLATIRLNQDLYSASAFALAKAHQASAP